MVAPSRLAGIFPRVFDQVLQHGADESAIRVYPDAVVDGEADPATGLAGLQFTGDGGDLRAEIDRFEAHFRARYLGQEEQVIDECAHPLGGRLDPLHVPAAGFVETVAVVLRQRFAVPAQRPQRGAQIMGDRVGERLQVLVRHHQRRTLLDAGLEFRVERRIEPGLEFRARCFATSLSASGR